MKYKAYIINFDIDTKDKSIYTQLYSLLTNDTDIITWWHYFQSSYMIVVNSDITATIISDFVRKNFKDKLFIVTQLNLSNHDGWLPNDAWEWINEAIELTNN